MVPKYSAPLAAKLRIRSPNVLGVQEHARRPLLPWQVWWGSVLNFLRLLPTGDPTECRSQKYGKIEVFAAKGRQNIPIETKFGT